MRLSVLVAIFVLSAVVMAALFLGASFFLSYHPRPV